MTVQVYDALAKLILPDSSARSLAFACPTGHGNGQHYRSSLRSDVEFQARRLPVANLQAAAYVTQADAGALPLRRPSRAAVDDGDAKPVIVCLHVDADIAGVGSRCDAVLDGVLHQRLDRKDGYGHLKGVLVDLK